MHPVRALLCTAFLPLLSTPPDPSPNVRLQEDIAWLAGAETQGRGHGSEGLEKAARFLEARHRSLHLQPQIQRFEARGPLVALAHHVTFQGKPLVWERDLFAPQGGEVHVKDAPLVGLDLGQALPETLKGQVALLREGTADELRKAFPQSDPPSLVARAATVAHLKPTAVLVLPTSHSREMLLLSSRGLPGAPTVPLLCLTASARDTCFKHAAPAAGKAGNILGRMDMDIAHAHRQVHIPNVVSVIPGCDPQWKDEYLLLLAHFDHLGTSAGMLSLAKTADARALVHPGADDNASGTALVLDLARQIAAHPLKRSVVILHVSGEEMGLLGSAYWAEHPTVPLEQVKFAFNFDMVGRLDPQAPKLEIGTLCARTEAVARLEAHVPKHLPLTHDLGIYLGMSDHASLAPKRIPVAFYSTGLHPDYHTPQDTADKINVSGMAQVEAAAYAAIREFGDAERLDVFDAAAFQALYPPPAKPMKATFGAVGGDQEDPRGLVLEEIRTNSAAAALGLQAGDVLVSLGDAPIRTLFELNTAMASHQAGDRVHAVWFRGTQRMEGDAVLKGR